jgi:hypothetical protein
MTDDATVHMAASKRLRRARGWLVSVLFLHGATLAFVLFAIVGGSISPPAVAALAGGLAFTSLILLVIQERRLPTAQRPALWMRRGSMVVLLHSIAFGIAATSTLDGTVPTTWHGVALFAGGIFLAELGTISLASRSLQRPLSADLAELDVEVLTKIRPASERLPAWLGNDDVRLTNRSVIITVRPDLKWGFAQRIDLADIIDIDVRPTQPEDGPWLQVEGGRMFWPPSGDVVVVTHRHGTHCLPVQEPAGFADVLRARIRKETAARKDESHDGASEHDAR